MAWHCKQACHYNINCDRNLSWVEASSKCDLRHGHLVTIDSEIEDTVLYGYRQLLQRTQPEIICWPMFLGHKKKHVRFLYLLCRIISTVRDSIQLCWCIYLYLSYYDLVDSRACFIIAFSAQLQRLHWLLNTRIPSDCRSGSSAPNVLILVSGSFFVHRTGPRWQSCGLFY